MKKIVFGGFMLLSGVMGTAILMLGAMISDAVIQASFGAHGLRATLPMPSVAVQLRMYQLQIPFAIFAAAVILGLALCIWGLIEKSRM